MRRVLISVIAAVSAVAIIVGGIVGVDYGASIYAEYHLSRSVREAANLESDPFVAILAFPFIPEAMQRHYRELEIKANGIDHAPTGKATLEATMHSIDLTYASWLIRPDAKLPVGKLESRIILDSTHLGRYLGMDDLMVEAPPAETNDATGGTTESGISGSHGLVFSGTPKSANFDHRVSVSMDLSIAPMTRQRWCSPRPASSPDRIPPTKPSRTISATRCCTSSPPDCPISGFRSAWHRAPWGTRLGRDHRRHHHGSNRDPGSV